MTPLEGKRALVTGGTRGIGLATAAALGVEGAEVVVTGRHEDACAAAVAELRAAGVEAAGRVADVADRKAMAALFEAVGGLDILVNNAATVEPIGRITEVALADWAKAIEVNVVGAFHAIQLAVAAMLGRGGGTIVNLSSGAAHRPLEGWSAYCTGKAALAMLTEAVHLEYAAQGIRVFGFAPGVVDTEMQAAIRASGINEVSRLPREALAPPSEPARAVAWLCSDAAGDWAGREVDIRDPELRRAVGLGIE